VTRPARRRQPNFGAIAPLRVGQGSEHEHLAAEHVKGLLAAVDEMRRARQVRPAGGHEHPGKERGSA